MLQHHLCEEGVSPTEEEAVTETEEEVAEEEEAPPTPPSDTTPPSAIIGLVAIDAYDGRVNLSWDKSTAEDFDHYDIYIGKSEIIDVSGMTPIHQIIDIATNTYQATGLEDGTKCYFAVTAVDKRGNENTKVASASVTPTPMPRGTIDPAYLWMFITLIRHVLAPRYCRTTIIVEGPE